MKRLIAVLAVAAGLVLPAGALAAGPYTQPPGHDNASTNTPCADHGSFGYFGDKGAVHDFGTNYPGGNGVPGADGRATSYNNSHLCGNPQNQ